MKEKTYCCRLAAAIEQERLLFETDNYFVIPTLGSIGLEGYLLIVPKVHYPAIAMIPERSHSELNKLLGDVKKLIRSEYDLSTLVFEHGPRLDNLDSGQSIDHAHLHIVPGIDITKAWAIDLMIRLGQIGQYYKVERVEGFSRARGLIDSGTSYLYVQNPEGVQLLSEQNFHRPSQYFRTMIANQIGSNKWNWREHPDNETLEKTVSRLKGKL